jgi:ABC-2 type transport system ATP-binding protein
MTRAGTAITTRGMRKSFGGHTVLDDVDLEVGEGTIFALLGPNGAGKTTIVRILSTLIRADAGAIRVAGHDLAADPDGVRAAIGVTGQFSAVDNLLTGQENLQAAAAGRRPRGWPRCDLRR